MRKKWLIVTSAVCALPLLAALLLGRPWEQEPRYQGHPLSYWLASTRGATTHEEDLQIAMEHVGTNALPFLLKSIRYERPHWRDVLYRETPDFFDRLTITSTELQADASEEALTYLGTNAAAALPELTILANDTNAPDTAGRAMTALATIGPAGIEALSATARDTNNPNCYLALANLGWRGCHALQPLRIAALVQLMDGTNPPAIREASARLLGEQIEAATLALPPLIHCITNETSDSNIRVIAIASLRAFRSNAKDTLPALTNALTDRSAEIRTAATNAINDTLHPPPFCSRRVDSFLR